MTGSIRYRFGVPESLRIEAARLYDEAFGRKFSVAIANTKKRRDVLAESFRLAYAAAAISDGELVGLAGFHTQYGALTSGMSGELLLERLGTLSGLWAAIIFSIYSRQPRASELLMDGIAVRRDMRGKGIGTYLLNDLKHYARENGFRTIRLDVIDTNPAARRLYERQGFVPTRTERFGCLRWLLGFGASTTMIFDVEGSA
ncbi:MAG: GNAT family N-acetyltransferase [Desulfobacteraceae bacterium]|jgi:ribosomal protein S18 acetylase RimI-like enzyme